MLTQNASARIRSTSTLSRTACNTIRARAVAGIQPIQLDGVVALATFPSQSGQVDVVVQAEILERREQLPVQCLPQVQFDRRTPIEPAADVPTVGAVRGGGQPEQDLRFEPAQQPLVGRCLGVVELVDDHHVELVRRELRPVQ
ncbi:hypothetical protein GCM10027280_61330 [Micromonospora polyrhachis]